MHLLVVLLYVVSLILCLFRVCVFISFYIVSVRYVTALS